jgi:hypothetical protein
MMPRAASISDHAQAKREAAIQRDRVADDLGEKAIARIAGTKWNRYPVSVRALFSIHKSARSQFAGAVCRRVQRADSILFIRFARICTAKGLWRI